MTRPLDSCDNVRGRPWPVSPYQYPLQGPTSGPVYCPPTHGTRTGRWSRVKVGNPPRKPRLHIRALLGLIRWLGSFK